MMYDYRAFDDPANLAPAPESTTPDSFRETSSPPPLTPEPLDLSPVVSALEDVRAVVGDVSTTVLNRFVSLYNTEYASPLNRPDYMIWRESEYNYIMVIADSEQSTTISPSGYVSGGHYVYRYTTYQGGYNYLPVTAKEYRQARQYDIPSTGSYGSAYVYSNVGDFLPASGIDYSYNLRPAVLFGILTLACVTITAVIMRRIFTRAK